MTKMIKTILLFLLFFSLSFSFNKANAAHVLGADAHWKNLGNDTFEITFVVYRRCIDGQTSLNLPALPPTLISDSCSYSYTVNLDTAISYTIEDISKVCTSLQSPCTVTGGITGIPYGIERHTVVYKVYLGGNYANCCWYKLKWQYCCRSSNITAGYADATFYDEFMLNRCVVNNSPRFTSNLLVYKCAGQDISYNLGMVDDEHDSLTYSLSIPLAANYTSPWSATYPLTCLGGNNPNPAANPPTGFNLDPHTGDIVFRPMQVQITVIKVTVKEWRKISGVVTLIGVTNRDLQFAITQNCNNKTPSLSGPYTYNYCAGSQSCQTISTNDPDLTDTVKLTTNSLISFPGSTFTLSSNNYHASGTFCWTPDSTDVRPGPYYFVARAYDSHCPMYGETYRAYTLYVNPKLVIPTKMESLTCADFNFKALNTTAPNSRQWRVYNGATLLDSFLNVDTVFNYKFKTTGTFYIKYSANNSYCSFVKTDTIVITNATPLGLVTSHDTTLCKGNAITLSTVPVNGSSPYSYQWYLNGSLVDTAQSITVTPAINSKYIVAVMSGDSCKINKKDTINITIDSTQLQVSSLRDTIICKGSGLNIIPKIISGKTPLQYKWYKNGTLISILPALYITPTSGSDYVLAIVSANQCFNEFRDTLNVSIDTTRLEVAPLKDSTICNGSGIDITPTIINGIAPFVYQWFKNGALISTSSTLTVTPSVSTDYNLKLFSDNKCFNEFNATVHITVLTSGLQVDAFRDTTVCKASTLNIIPVITKGKAPFTYNWFDGATLVSTSAKLTIAPRVNSDYTLNIVSADQCFNTAQQTIHITVDTSALLINALNDTAVCFGSGVSISPSIKSGTAPFQYMWFVNGTQVSSAPTLTSTLTSTSTCILNLYSSDNCYNRIQDTFTINIFPSSQIIVTAGNTNLAHGQSTVLKSNGKSNFIWSGLNIIANWGDSVLVKPEATTTYLLICRNQNGCVDTGQITINISFVGVQSMSMVKGEKLKINPNPAFDRLTIDNGGLAIDNGQWTIDNVEYRIYDVLGKVSLKGKITAKETIVHIASLAKGIYFVRVGEEVRKFVKE